jgi:serine/threonine-protein kinase
MYMSPEQARNAKTVTERTDVWSLSVVLWEALSGRRLWGGQSSLGELIVAICTQPVQRLDAVAPWIPHELTRVVHRGLERDPELRTPSVRALLEQLEPFSGGSDRIAMSQLHGLTEQQRGELSLKVSLSDSAMRGVANLSGNASAKPALEEIGASSTIGGDARPKKPRKPAGSGRGAMLGVAVLSAAVAGGSAYFFARNVDHGAASTAPPRPARASGPVMARVEIMPTDSRVITREGVLPVEAGAVTLRGQAGDTVSVTLERGPVRRTFSVTLGPGGIATPNRLVLE